MPVVSLAQRHLPQRVWSMEQLKVLPDLPGELVLDDPVLFGRWGLIDCFAVGDPDQATAHGFAVGEVTGCDFTSLLHRYPGGRPLPDRGLTHSGGHVTYLVRGLSPGAPLLIVRRLDAAWGEHTLRYTAEGRPAGICQVLLYDTAARWRNWPHVIPGGEILAPEVTIRQEVCEPGAVVSMYRYWFYQPVE